MKGFLDRLVSRASGRGTSLRPRVGHRYGPPQHDLPPADGEHDAAGGAAAGGEERGEAGEVLHVPEVGRNSERAVGLAAPSLPAGEGGSRREASGTTAFGSGPRFQAEVLARGVDGPSRVADRTGGAEGGGPETPGTTRTPGSTPDGQPSVTVERRPPPADAAARTGTSAQATLVERLQARLRIGRDQQPSRAATALDETSATLSAGESPSATVPHPPQAGSPPGVPRSIENVEDAFWRFLYGPGAEASPDRGGPKGEGRALAVGPSSFETPGAGAKTAASATSNVSATPRPINITVGRIDVRNPAGPAPRSAAGPARRPPRLGLADYMRQSAPGHGRR
jgi:hypothetical protein